MKPQKLCIPIELQQIAHTSDRCSDRLRRLPERYVFRRSNQNTSGNNSRGLRDRCVSLLHDAWVKVMQSVSRMNPNEPKQTDPLKKKLLLMASNAEQCVQKAVHSLVHRDQSSAVSAKEQDSVIDQLEKDVDELAIKLLA